MRALAEEVYMNTVITTDSLTKRYGNKEVVKELDLKVPEGSIYGFLGPNGAGKSTTLKMVLGLVKPTQGHITIFDKTSHEAKPTGDFKNTGSLIESPAYYGHLSGREKPENYLYPEEHTGGKYR